MKNILLLLTLCLITTILLADNKYFYTTATSGLRIRKEPSINSLKMGLIPFGTKIKTLEKSKNVDTISGKKSHWYRIKYKNLNGWVFGNFLSKIKGC